MSDETLSSRWSQRKAAVAAEKLEAEKPVAVAKPAEPEKTEEDLLKEFGLKKPEDMVEGDDFSGFMNKAIPSALRNRALRKLWTSNPALGVVDGLVDYGDDFTGKGDVIGKITTAYKVGKGFVEKLTAEAEPEPDATDTDSDEITENKPIENVKPPQGPPDLTPQTIAPPPPENVSDVETPARPARNRMIFDFDKSE